MKTLKQLLFAGAVMICFSMTGSAQEGDKKTPPKKDPPIVIVKDKDKPKEDKPKEDKPKDDKKKPQAFIFYFRNE